MGPRWWACPASDWALPATYGGAGCVKAACASKEWSAASQCSKNVHSSAALGVRWERLCPCCAGGKDEEGMGEEIYLTIRLRWTCRCSIALSSFPLRFIRSASSRYCPSLFRSICGENIIKLCAIS